jgi:hypothetical protein
VVTATDEVTGLKLGTATVDAANYSVSGNELTIKKEYLDDLETGAHVFTVLTADGNGTLTITVVDTTPTATPNTATFDKNTAGAGYDDVESVIANGEVSAVKNGGSTVNTDNYTVIEGILTIKKEYLVGLTVGEKTFTIETDNGNCTIVITVVETASVLPVSATYDLNAAGENHADIEAVVSDGTVSAVKNGEDALTPTTDYTESSGTVTLLSTYLATLTVGTYSIIIETDNGNCEIALTVEDTTT